MDGAKRTIRDILSITKEIVWQKILAMRDEEIKVVNDRKTVEIIAEIVNTKEPFRNGFIITFDSQTNRVHKSYFIMPGGCQYCANSIWADYFMHAQKQILEI
jgi:hypothetical protein